MSPRGYHCWVWLFGRKNCSCHCFMNTTVVGEGGGYWLKWSWPPTLSALPLLQILSIYLS